AADRHQAGHLVLGDVDFLAPVIGQGDVCNLVIAFGREGLDDVVHGVLRFGPRPHRNTGSRVGDGNRAPLLRTGRPAATPIDPAKPGRARSHGRSAPWRTGRLYRFDGAGPLARPP